MLQKKWHQLEQQESGIQITPTSLTRNPLGSCAGATTAITRTPVCSTSTGATVTLARTTLPAQ